MSGTPDRALEKRGIVFIDFVPDPELPDPVFLYRCFICNRKLRSEETCISHIDSTDHILNTNRFNLYIKIIPAINSVGRTSLSCKLCDHKPTWQEAAQHVTTHKVISWLKPKDLSEALFRHFISTHKNNCIYKCNLCNFFYADWFHALEHSKDSKHIRLWNQTSASTAKYALYEKVNKIFEILIANRIFIGETRPYHCHNCNLSFDDANRAIVHAEVTEHKDLKDKFQNEICEFKSQIPESFQWIKKSAHVVVMRDRIFCKICGIYMIDVNEIETHMKSHKKMDKKTIQKGKSLKEQDNSNSDFSDTFHSPKLGISLVDCDLVVPPEFKWMIFVHKIIVNKQDLYCTICDKRLTNNSAIISHLKTHLKPGWRVENAARLQEIERQGCTSKQGLPPPGAGTSGTVKRKAKSTVNLQQRKVQKLKHSSGPKDSSRNVGNFIQILPQRSQPDNYPLENSETVRNLPSHSRQVGDSLFIVQPSVVGASKERGFTRFAPNQTNENRLAACSKVSSLNQNVNNRILIVTPADPVLSQTRPVSNEPLKKYSGFLQSNNEVSELLNKLNYFFFPEDEIYKMPIERKRRIILSSQLSFLVEYSSDYFIYCVVCEKSIPYNLQNVYEHWRSSEHNEYLMKMEEDDQQFSIYQNQFSCLALSKEFMIQNRKDELALESDSGEFTCCACKATVQDQDVLLRQHIQSEDHGKNIQRFRRHSEELIKDLLTLIESSWYCTENYSCSVCQEFTPFEICFVDHMESEEHLSIMLAMEREQRDKYSLDSCAVCGILWFGDQNEYSKHCYFDAYHKQWSRSIEDRVDYLPDEASNMCSSPEMVIAELVKEADKVIQDRGRDSELIRSLELAVTRKFPDAKAHPFGSRITGLGSTTSDLDIFLDCGGTYYGRFSNSDLVDVFPHCLKLDSQAWRIEDDIIENRIPVLKVYHSHSQLKCDVSFTNGLGVENTKLLKTYLDAYPQCREMILFIKKWLTICNITGPRNITNYAISWFVIFFLQTRDILPRVASLTQSCPKPFCISGWRVGTSTFTVGKKQEEITTKELLKGFFSYYAEFDYRCNLACPLLGTVMPKKDFLCYSLLPVEMRPYINFASRKKYPELFVSIDSLMCIQDPYDLSNNLTKNVSKKTLERFRKLCKKSARIFFGRK